MGPAVRGLRISGGTSFIHRLHFDQFACHFESFYKGDETPLVSHGIEDKMRE
jgi:hypothetical protein